MADLTPQKLTALSNRLTRLEQRTGFELNPPCPAPAASPGEARETLRRLVESGAFQPTAAWTNPDDARGAWWWRLGEALFGPGWRETAADAAASAEREERDRGDHREDAPTEIG